MTVSFHLPWPPSVNHYWRKMPRGMRLSDAGKRYREDAAAFLIAQFGLLGRCPTVDGRLLVAIEANPPDKRRRDLDNLLKVPLDVMQHLNIYEDDSQIDDLRIRRGDIEPGGGLWVTVETITGAPCPGDGQRQGPQGAEGQAAGSTSEEAGTD